MSAELDLFTAIQTVYTADSGVGGLSETGGAAQVRANDFLRADSVYELAAPYWPGIIVDCRARRESDTFGLGKLNMRATFNVWSRRRADGFTAMDAVCKRIRFLYHTNAALVAATDWAWSVMVYESESPLRTEREMMRRSIAFGVIATRTSGVV